MLNYVNRKGGKEMYSMTEYIYCKRSAYIFRKLLERGSSYNTTRCVDGEVCRDVLDANYIRYIPEEMLKTQITLESMFRALYDDIVIKRFITIHEMDDGSIKYIPVTLFEVIDPHVMIPVIITTKDVFIVSPFGNVTRNSGDNIADSYIWSIAPTQYFYERGLTEETIDFWEQKVGGSDVTIREYISSAIALFIERSGKSYELISENFDDIDSLFITETSEGEPAYENVVSRFGLESIVSVAKVGSKPIPDEAFLPMEVKIDSSSDSLVITVKNIDGRMRLDTTNINPDTPLIVVPVDAKYITLMLLDPSYYYVGNGAISKSGDYYDENTNIQLLDMMVTKEEEALSMLQEHDPNNLNIGTESAISMIRDIKSAIKIFGIRRGSELYNLFMKIIRGPGVGIKFLYNIIKEIVTNKNKLEKSNSLDVQEQMLNDELDSMSNHIKFAIKNGIQGTVLTFGFLPLLPVMYLLMRNKNKKVRLKSIERCEFKVLGMLERVEAKLEHARQESDYESVDALLAEKHHLEFALVKLREFKNETVSKSKAKFIAFDKEQTTNARQRIEEVVEKNALYE